MTDSTAPTPETNAHIIKVSAYPMLNGDVELEYLMPGVEALASNLSRQVLKASEEAVQQALIALGWTPPAALRASQSVAEGAPVAWLRPSSPELPENVITDACKREATAETSPEVSLKEAAKAFTIPLYAHPAPAPEGGTLPPGCPETDALVGEVAHLMTVMSDESIADYAKYNPDHLRALGASLRAADLGRGRGLFDPARLPKRDEFGFMWHPDMDVLLPCEDSTDEQAANAARALGWEYKSVNWEDDDPDGNISVWHPKPPDGDGWKLVALLNTVEGDYYASFVRPALPSAAQLKGGGDGR